MTEEDDADPEENASYAAVISEIREIMADAAVVLAVVFAIFAVAAVSHRLMPPEGPVFFRETRFEFPFQWMVDASHTANFGTFIIRVVRRMWR